LSDSIGDPGIDGQDEALTAPSTADPLLILAMDHRDSFEKLFGVAGGDRSPAQETAMRTAKELIYRGLHDARSQLDAGQAGVLVDEELGAAVLRAAREDGLVLAMPVEKSGQKLFSLQYGEDTSAHIAAFSPDYVKVLVRMNPADPAEDTKLQLEALSALSALLHTRGTAFLYELLVPPAQEQLQRAGSQPAYDRDLRPALVAEVIAMNQRAGVEPTLWKIEGLETTAAAHDVVAAAKADGRTTDCIVLGRDAPRDMLDHWLAVAAPVPGFVGFAVGRSIWEDPLVGHLEDADDARLVETVRENYLHFARAYLDARPVG
jgi:myo-inositol catabolism protein IolC